MYAQCVFLPSPSTPVEEVMHLSERYVGQSSAATLQLAHGKNKGVTERSVDNECHYGDNLDLFLPGRDSPLG